MRRRGAGFGGPLGRAMSTTSLSCRSVPSVRAGASPVAVAAGGALALLLSLAPALSTWRTGAFGDTDDAMRAVQLRDWMAGQGWFDLTAHRLGPPPGVLMHWSRVVDVPLALFVRVFSLGLAPEMAERAARIAFPVLLQLGLVAAVAALARRVAGPAAALPAALLIVFGGIGYGQFVPGRIDHHAPQILLLTVMAGALLSSLDPARARAAAVAGAAAALSMAISLENLPFIAVLLAILPCAWVWSGGHRAAMAHLALGLGPGATALFFATVPPARYGVASADAFSAPHLAGALIGSTALLLFAVLPRRAGMPGRAGVVGRVALALGAAVAAGTALLAVFPGCLAGPYAAMDPVVKALWLDRVSEAMPLGAALAHDGATTLGLVGPAALGVLATLAAAASARGLARLRWSALAALVLAGFAGTLWEIRVAYSLQPLAVAGAAWAISRSLAWARERGPAALALPAALFLCSASAGWSLLPLAGASAAPAGMGVAGAACDAPEAFDALRALPPALAFAPIDIGPMLLAYTDLSAVAGPYHRDMAGLRAALDGFRASPEGAEGIVRGTGARLVVVCSAAPGADVGGGDLLSALAAGRAPAWLAPVPMAGTPFRVFRME